MVYRGLYTTYPSIFINIHQYSYWFMVIGTHTYHNYIYIYVVYRWYIEVVNGVYKPTYNCGGHHLVARHVEHLALREYNGCLVPSDCNRCQGVRHQAPEAGRRDWNQVVIERSCEDELLLHVVPMAAQAVPSSLDGELPWCKPNQHRVLVAVAEALMVLNLVKPQSSNHLLHRRLPR